MKDGTEKNTRATATKRRGLFKPGSWLAKIDFINHLILFNNVLVTVLAEKSGGKTTFCSLVQSGLDPKIKCISMQATASINVETITSALANQLHFDKATVADMVSIAAHINEGKEHVLLVIDDAQHVPDALIQELMVVIKSQEEFGFFHLCLVADHSIVDTLNALAVDKFNNLVHTIEIGSLNETETRTYALQRALTANLITLPLPEIYFKQFYQLTKGNLAKINSSIEPFILNCNSEKKPTSTFHLKRTSMAVSAVLVAGCIYLSFDMFYRKTTRAPVVEKELVFVPKPVLVEEPRVLVSYIPSWEDSSSRQLVQIEAPKQEALEEGEEENHNTVALVDKVLVIPKFNLHAETQAVVENPKPKVVSPKLKPVIRKVVKNGNGSRYTIQLVASHRKSDVLRFKQHNALLAKAKIMHFTNAKGNWYILTLGEYSSLNEAQLHSRKLPAGLEKLHPWVRSTSGLNKVG